MIKPLFYRTVSQKRSVMLLSLCDWTRFAPSQFSLFGGKYYWQAPNTG